MSKYFFITLALLIQSWGITWANELYSPKSIDKIEKRHILKGAVARTKHHLTPGQLSTLIHLAIEGRPEEGWKKLAEYGDPYADDAYSVISKTPRFPSRFLYNLIKANWNNTAGEDAYRKYFKSFAVQHFRQYVTILSQGHWPDAEQICLSYRKSAEDHQIPVSVVTDGILTASGLNNLVAWQDVIGLNSQRRKGCGQVFDDIGTIDAIRILAQDIWEAATRLDSYNIKNE